MSAPQHGVRPSSHETRQGWTAGPWWISTANPNNFSVFSNNGRVAYTAISQLSSRCKEGQANARLIAAALRLYAALENLLGQFDQAHIAHMFERSPSAQSAMAEATAALKLARGEA
jgi:hypothetical protein